MEESSDPPEINADISLPETSQLLEDTEMPDAGSGVVVGIVTEVQQTTAIDPSTSTSTTTTTTSETTIVVENVLTNSDKISETIAATIAANALEESMEMEGEVGEKESIEETTPIFTEQSEPFMEASESTPEQKIAESVEATVAASSRPLFDIDPEQKIAKGVAVSSEQFLSETPPTPEQKVSDSEGAISAKMSAPPNPKSHPALPRPPSQPSQRPVFHIIAPRSAASESTTRIYRPRQYVAKSSADIRPNVVRPYEPRRYIRIDKPPMTIQRPPRKTAPSIVNILQSAATSKIPIRTTSHKPINIHQLPAGPSTSKPPKPATSAPPPSGPVVTLLKPPKSVTPQPSTAPIRGPRKTKQISSQRTSEEPEEKRKKGGGKAPPESSALKEEEKMEVQNSEQDPNRSARQRDALEYLEEVKRKFDPITYNTFLEVMKGFKQKNMNTIGVIRRICYLFASEPSLIDGFNNFLPQGFDINHDGKIVKIRDPEGNTHDVNISDDPNLAELPGPSTSTVPIPQQPPQPQQLLQQQQQVLMQQQQQPQQPSYLLPQQMYPQPFLQMFQQYHYQQQQLQQHQQQEQPFDNAVTFLQSLKNKVSLEKYEKFLEIIKSNEANVADDPDYSKEKNMFQKVANVLESDQDLLVKFSSFLPGIHNWCVIEHYKRNISEGLIRNKDFYRDLELNFRRYSTDEKFTSGSSDVEDAENNQQLTDYIPLRSRPIKNLLHIVKTSLTDDYVFFDKFRETINDDKIFENFARCLRLYTNGLIKRDELFSITAPFFNGFPLLLREFKRIMGYSDGYIPAECPNHEIVGEGGVDLDMKNELDFTTLKCNGRSYRLLPEKYRHPKCSGRTELCHEVLNDDWAIFPSWQSEETTRVSFKKSSFEEFLHRTEDERFEIDILIQVNTEAMTALERIRKYASKDPRYVVGDNYECGSSTFMIRAIRRAYGENAQRVLDALKKNPLLVANTVLNRLKIKQREWKNMENAFKLVWEDQARKYYLKMTDNRITKVKRSDIKMLKGNLIFTSIEKLFKQRHVQSLRGQLEKEQKIHKSTLYLSFPSQLTIIRDIQGLLMKYLRRQQTIEKEEKLAMQQFIFKVLPMFFDLPIPKNFEAAATDDSSPFQIPYPRPPSIQPRRFYCSDDFVHFIYLFQVIAVRLRKLFVRSQEYMREEEHKFEILKLRMRAFKEAGAKLPDWCDNQQDILSGWDAILPEKRRSHDRFLTYMSDLESLIDGTMQSNVFDENVKSLFEADAYPVLGLDKFIATMTKLLQNISQDPKMCKMINKYWPLNYLPENANAEKAMTQCIEAVPKIFDDQNAYSIEVFDQKQIILGVKMITFVTPYVEYAKKFKSKDWKVYRRTYRNELNAINRQKEQPCKYKSKPLFLLRNLKKGYERLGRFIQQDEPSESSSSEESCSDEEGEKKSKKSDHNSDQSEVEEESDFEVPYKGQPALLKRKSKSYNADDDSDELDTEYLDDNNVIVVDRACHAFIGHHNDMDVQNFASQLVEIFDEEAGSEGDSEDEDNEFQYEITEFVDSEDDTENEGQPGLDDNANPEEDTDDDEEEGEEEDIEMDEGQKINQKRKLELFKKLKQAARAAAESAVSEDEEEATEEESESEEEGEENEQIVAKDNEEEEEDTSEEKSDDEEESEDNGKETVTKPKGKKPNKEVAVVGKRMNTRGKRKEKSESASSKESGEDKSPASFVEQKPLLLPPGPSRAPVLTKNRAPVAIDHGPTPERPSQSPPIIFSHNVITEKECRRRINKFTAHQTYKMIKSEFRSARIQPVSDTEHDYDEYEIDQFGGLHLIGSDIDRQWWTDKLKLKKDKTSKKKQQQQIDLDSSSEEEEEEEEEEESRPQRKQSRRPPPPPKKPRKKPGPKKGWKKRSAESPASATSEKKSTSVEFEAIPAEKYNPIHEAPKEEEEESAAEVRLPAPPRRYSSSPEHDDDDDEEVETARGGGGGSGGRESPKMDFDEMVELESDSETSAAAAALRERRTSSRDSKASKKSNSKAPQDNSDFVRTTRSRSQSISKASQIPSSSEATKLRVSFSDEKKLELENSDAESSSTEGEEGNSKQKRSSSSTSSSPSSDEEMPTEKKETTFTSLESGNETLKEDAEKAMPSSKSKTSEKNPSKMLSETEEEEAGDEEEEADEEVQDEEETELETTMEAPKRAEKVVAVRESEERIRKPLPKIGIWMTPDLAESCKSNLCSSLIVLQNATAPGVMYRMGPRISRKEYKAIKRQKFEEWLCKRIRRKRSKRRKHHTSESIDEGQAFIDFCETFKDKESFEKREAAKSKSKQQNQQQHSDGEED